MTYLLTYFFQPCKVVDSVQMLCLMPAVPLPWDFEFGLNSNKTVAVSTDTPGVASYIGPNGKDRVDVYVGFAMDGYTGYRNISTPLPNILINFYLKPTLSCSTDVNFDPYSDDMLTVKVSLSVQNYSLFSSFLTSENEETNLIQSS